jgi:hypothetical protein
VPFGRTFFFSFIDMHRASYKKFESTSGSQASHQK